MSDLDFTELDGFQFEKERRIAEWRARKDKREFQKLCRRLMTARWRRGLSDERRAEYLAKARADMGRRYKAKQAEKHARDRSRVLVCQECGVEFQRLPGTTGPKPKFCTMRCYQRQYHREWERKRTGAKRRNRCGRCGKFGHNKRSCRA